MIQIFVLGFVGNYGTKILIDEKKRELEKYFSCEFLTKTYVKLNESLDEGGFNPSLSMLKSKVFDYEIIGKGGILASLWKLCERNKWGLKYELCKIPILQGTIEISNYFGINPYRLLTKNAYVIAKSIDCGIDYDVKSIGLVTNEKKRVRIDGEAEAFLTKDYKDEINKIMPALKIKYD